MADTLYTHPDGTTVTVTHHDGGVYLSVTDQDVSIIAIRFEASVLEAVGTAILLDRYPSLAPLIGKARA